MSNVSLLVPDRQFVEEIIASGGADLKKCYQCATCSVACELAGDSRPFPRKEMIWAQWGLKDRLAADPDVWLCHRCNDCSLKCPRGARPGDVLAAVRQWTIQHFAVPKFLGGWVNDTKMQPVLMGLTAALLAVALWVREPIEGALGIGEPHGFYAEFFPHWLLIGFFASFTIVAFVAALLGIARFWRAMKDADVLYGSPAPPVGIVKCLARTAAAVFAHNRFSKCSARPSGRVAHLTVFYGFVALFVVTIWATLDLYAFPHLGIDSLYPFELAHPMKVLANVGGILLVFGCAKAIVDRLRNANDAQTSTAFDWMFIWLLLGVGVTGFVIEALRFGIDPTAESTAVSVAYALYFVHLVLVFQLLVYLPYSKFAHLLYRTTAMVYAEHTGRTNGVRQPRQLVSSTQPDVPGAPREAETIAAKN
ncbi:MAG: quinone-interacting membrane-bound oxidoreductase complex subunit QmoC [Gemmatimonadales bacterium]|jgi:quinone-modifying oxidoreductase subunit QmoC